ncbi:hypothetical protein [Streptomyces sp. NPDC016675]|uniref:hypothetical protein n=1 Tax=Streptomyces sp. NPDC016675 TaxID=3364970 RepID=UPI0036F4C551
MLGADPAGPSSKSPALPPSKGSSEVHDEGPDDDLAEYAAETYFAAEPAHPEVYALKLADGARSASSRPRTPAS